MNLTDIAGFGKSLGFTIFNAARTSDHSRVTALAGADIGSATRVTSGRPRTNIAEIRPRPHADCL
jgi:ribosomal protein S13